MDYSFPKTDRQAELIALADSLTGPFAARAESVDREGSYHVLWGGDRKEVAG